MKFLIDAQLPRRLASRLQEAGHEALHTLDLPLGNRTPDAVINELSVHEGYVVVTKDADFAPSFFLRQRPRKLLLVSTGNIRNMELESLFLATMASIIDNFAVFYFIEINRQTIIYHT